MACAPAAVLLVACLIPGPWPQWLGSYSSRYLFSRDMTCINARSSPPDAWRWYLLHDFLRGCGQTLVTSDRTPTIDHKKQFHSGLSQRNSELGVTHWRADNLYSRVIEKSILARGDGSWQLCFWGSTLSLEEAHEAVYYLYNRAEELWSLLSFLWALWVLHSSSLCISIQGKQMQNTVLLGGCVPLDGQQTPIHQCFFSRLTAFQVPFRPRASSTEAVAGLSSSPHFFLFLSPSRAKTWKPFPHVPIWFWCSAWRALGLRQARRTTVLILSTPVALMAFWFSSNLWSSHSWFASHTAEGLKDLRNFA